MFNHQFVETPTLIKFTDSDGIRYYETPDGRFESTTTFLARVQDKDWLKKWQKRVGNKAAHLTASARSRGDKLHKAIETYLLNDDGYKTLIGGHVYTKALFYKIKPLLDRLDNIRLIEKAIWSKKLKLAGTPDCIADFDGKLSTIDMKTSTRDKLEEWITGYRLQTAIYSVMYYERFGISPQQSVIIMAVEDNPQPMLFIEPIKEQLERLSVFLQKHQV